MYAGLHGTIVKVLSTCERCGDQKYTFRYDEDGPVVTVHESWLEPEDEDTLWR